MKSNSLDKIDMKVALKNLFFVVLGTVILSLGTALFVEPTKLVAGGASGIATILVEILPFEFLTFDLVTFVLTWLLFFLGLIILGKSFAMKTLVSTIVYSPALSLFMRMTTPDFLDGFLMMDPANPTHLIVSAVFYGIFCGIGCALTFIGGGSTGGSDIIGFIVSKFCKPLKSSIAIGIVDASIVILGMYFLKNFALTLLGVLAVSIATIVIDKVFIGTSKAFVAQIITDNYEDISRAVISELNRTTTIINAKGGYSGYERKMVMVSFSMREYSNLINIINKNDKKAFVTIYRAHEINGEGWTR